jgi:hypothetical protein
MRSGLERTVCEFAASPAFPVDGTCFAAGQNGLLKTIDYGYTWSWIWAVDSGSEQIATTAVAISPSFEHDRTVFTAIPGGIGRSQDAGETWTFVQLPLPAPLVTSIQVSPDFAHDRFILAGTAQDGMLISNDGGETWAAWNSGLFDLNVFTVAFSPNSPNIVRDHHVFAGTSTGLFQSINAGRLWSPIEVASDRTAILALAISPNPADGGDHYHLFAGTEHGLLASRDAGISWQHAGPDFPRGTAHAVASSANRDDLAVLCDSAVMRSDDGGDTWQEIESDNLPVSASLVTAIAVVSLREGEAIILVADVNGEIHRVDSVRRLAVSG